MPYYGAGGGPAEWAAMQQQRRDDQIRNILNMMMQFKQYQTERGDEMFNRGLEERRTAAYEKNAEPTQPRLAEWEAKLMHPEWFAEAAVTYGPEIEAAIEKKNKMAPGTFGKLPNEAKKELYQTYQRVSFTTPSAGGGATDYDKKVTAANALLKAGKITDQEYNRIVTGYGEDVTPRQNLSARTTIDLSTKRHRTAVSAGVKLNKKNVEQVRQTEGINLDYPLEYDVSSQRILGGVGDEADAKLVEDYDGLRKYFEEVLRGKMKFDDFIKTPARGKLNGKQLETLKTWFAIYG